MTVDDMAYKVACSLFTPSCVMQKRVWRGRRQGCINTHILLADGWRRFDPANNMADFEMVLSWCNRAGYTFRIFNWAVGLPWACHMRCSSDRCNPCLTGREMHGQAASLVSAVLNCVVQIPEHEARYAAKRIPHGEEWA